jgi:hypothetical protein
MRLSRAALVTCVGSTHAALAPQHSTGLTECGAAHLHEGVPEDLQPDAGSLSNGQLWVQSQLRGETWGLE